MTIVDLAEPAPFLLARGHNPDVLTCIANLSNDEVFTPPELAGEMLDTVAQAWADANNGAVIWEDPDVTFLDPFTKSGVFLREVVSRLTQGLADQIPDLQERVDHILTKQVYGIGITQLTALLARRSVYCSKDATGPHSAAKAFDRDWGNIWFERTEHTWAGEKCAYCGASKAGYGRGDELETHAYAFIHTTDPRAMLAKMFGADVQFDVIIGNPPYQLNDGGGEGASASPLYHRFVEQAKKLEPKQLIMVVPARWYSGGKGLDEFRASMLDGQLAEVHDFAETDLVFPGVNIRGGVCYFRWESGRDGLTAVTNHRKYGATSILARPALENGLSTFIRNNEAISILNKVRALGEPTMDARVQSRNPYGIPSNFSQFSTERTDATPVLLYRSRRGISTDKEVYIAESAIESNQVFKDRLKVLVSKASPGGDEYPHAVLGNPFITQADSVSTETYLIVDFVSTTADGDNLVSYMRTRFFRFLVSLIKTTQNISKGCFAFVPVQELTHAWTDVELYEKYGITDSEIAFIETMVRRAAHDGETTDE